MQPLDKHKIIGLLEDLQDDVYELSLSEIWDRLQIIVNEVDEL